MRVLISLGMFLSAVIFCIIWRNSPTLLFCCLFWASMCAANIAGRAWLFIPGMMCNAAATISNGGFMPVYGMELQSSGGVHIPWTADANLQFFCDVFWGFSVGDFLLFGALVCSISLAVMKAPKRSHA